MKDRTPVSMRVTLGLTWNIGVPGPGLWYSGPMKFTREAGVAPPVVKDGSMPKAVGDASSESAVLGFTVDPKGSVKNIYPVSGSQPGTELLSRSLATWKFQPAMMGGEPVEATGTVNFVKGRGSDSAPAAPAKPGVTLTPLDPVSVDDSLATVNGPGAAIDFINHSRRPVDIYWINYQGDRVLYRSGLAVGATWTITTGVNHLWLVVVSGTGGTTAQDTGTRLTAFAAVTPGFASHDIAIITDQGGAPSGAVPPPASEPAPQPAQQQSVSQNRPAPSPPRASIDGTLRRLAEKDLLLQIPSGKVLRFRLLGKTEFHGSDGRPYRDSLLHPGDRIRVGVNPDDVETVLNVVFIGSGNPAERDAASAPLEESRIAVPDEADFAKPGPGAATNSPSTNRAVSPPGLTTNPKDGLSYVWIPPGAFTMGCSPGDAECAGDEKPPHAEQIADGFRMGQTEVTQAAYRRVTGNNPSAHKGDRLPVETVTWNDAANYCAAIGGRLPSEREWEYAARAGTTGARYGNVDAVAWHAGNSGGMTHPVGLKPPNTFGLYDMLGNVWEWVDDNYAGNSDKVLRGGGVHHDRNAARASMRFPRQPSETGNGRGFRCVMDGAGSGEEASGAYGDVNRPSVVHKVDPEYSEEARKAKWSGSVTLTLVVDAKGRPREVRVIKSLGMGLDQKAIEAVRKWEFKPGTKDGKPVDAPVTVEVNFRLL